MPKCNDCGAEIEFKRENGRWLPPVDPDGVDHWRTCASFDARQQRIRRGVEPGFFPTSISGVLKYEDCPLGWRTFSDARNPDRIQDESGDAALLGRSFHDHAAAVLTGSEPRVPVIPSRLASSWSIMTNTFDRQVSLGEWPTHNASFEEEKLYAWQDGAVTVQYKGILDYWIYGRRSVVTDWKSGWNVPAKLDDDPQGLSYALLVMRNHPKVEEVAFQQVHFRFGGHVVHAVYDRRRVDEFEDWLRSTAARMLRDVEWQPNWYCATCPPGLHPVMPLVRKAPRTREEAVALAGALRQREGEASLERGLLKAWTAENGPVGGYGHHETKKWRIPQVLEAVEVLRAEGMMDVIGDYIGFDGSKLRSILTSKTKWVALAEKLRPLVEESVETRFDWREEGKRA